MIKFLLAGLCIFFDVIYIICKKENRNIIGLFAKVLAAFCFITIGYMGYLSYDSSFSYYVLIGLMFDGLGDLFLALRNLFAKNVNFAIGSVSFLLGHIMFIKALLLMNNPYLLYSITASVICGSLLFYLFNRICHLNKVFTIIGISYLITILMMLAMSIGVYAGYQTTKNLVFMMGALLFVSSDCILILYNFSKKEKWMHPTYSLLYFIAQILISFSLNI